jgi:iron complex transport system substrate-binding protein
MKSRLLPLIAFAAALASSAASAQLSVRDDLNRVLIVKKSATRVVTLAPFLTEILYAVGAGDLAVGVDEHSDYPPEILSVPKVAAGPGFSIERIAALKPDLVLAWRDGIKPADVERMSSAGATVFVASAKQLEDVPRLLQLVGQLTGRNPSAAITGFESRVAQLRRDYSGKHKLTTFLEIWNRPLTTVSGEHFLTEALDICRAENVFSDLNGVAPKVSIRELEEKNPYVIVGAGSASSLVEFRQNWVVRQSLNAVKSDRLVFLPDETLARPTPRTPDGISKLCVELDEIRNGKVVKTADILQGAGTVKGLALKPATLGPFLPSLANPVSPPLPTVGAGAKPQAQGAPATAPAAAPATPAPAQSAPQPQPEPENPSGKRPSQYGM